MIFPAEAVNAFKLLWNYYLAHVIFVIVLLWPAYAFTKLKYAVSWSMIVVVFLLLVECFQARFPSLGDGDPIDLAIGIGTVAICMAMFIPIRVNAVITCKKEE